MPEILHISDLHFGPPFLRDRAEQVHRLARRREPDVVVASGDFTQRAKPPQFEAAREYLAGFEAPLVVTPGNHDVPLYRVWERFLTPFDLYRTHISAELNRVHRLEGITIVSLNSARAFTFKNGKLHRNQLDFAAEAFAEAPADDLRAIVTHHHLAPPPTFTRYRLMPGARRALEVFGELGVHLILAGHMHRAYIGDSLDFFPKEEKREIGIVIAQCGTTTSARGRQRETLANSLNYIQADREEIFITHYLWRDREHGFWPHSRHRFGTRPDIWLEERGRLTRRGA